MSDEEKKDETSELDGDANRRRGRPRRARASLPRSGAGGEAKYGKRKTNGVKFVPTESERQLVAQAVIARFSHEDIAALVRDGISVPTLKKHFSSELATALNRAVIHANAEIQKFARGLIEAPPSTRLRALESFLDRVGGEGVRKKSAAVTQSSSAPRAKVADDFQQEPEKVEWTFYNPANKRTGT